jgi:hypothetical protein
VRTLALLPILAGLASAAAAQTNDHLFRSFRFAAQRADARSAGLGGAAAALGDTAGAGLANPAGLASLSKSELEAALESSGAGSSPVGDALRSRVGLSALALAWRARNELTLAAFVGEPHAHKATLSVPAGADGLLDRGALESSVTDFGLAAGWRARSWLLLGARVAGSRMALDGSYTREPAAGLPNLRVTTIVRDTVPTGAVGLLLLPNRRLRLGVVVESGAAWSAQRAAASPLSGTVLEADGRYEMRAPRVVTAGLAWAPSLRLTLVGQLDHVIHRDVHSGLVIGQGAHARRDYVLDNAWDGRAGLELSLPRRSSSLQVRAGVHVPAPALLRYTGSDAVERVIFAGEDRRAIATAGASYVTARSFRFDLAIRSGERVEILAGAAARF